MPSTVTTTSVRAQAILTTPSIVDVASAPLAWPMPLASSVPGCAETLRHGNRTAKSVAMLERRWERIRFRAHFDEYSCLISGNFPETCVKRIKYRTHAAQQFVVTGSLCAGPFVSTTFDDLRDPDVPANGPGLRRLYVAGESDVISMFKVERGKESKVAAGSLGPNAHVVSVDPISHLAYFPLMNLENRTMLRIMRPIPEAASRFGRRQVQLSVYTEKGGQFSEVIKLLRGLTKLCRLYVVLGRNPNGHAADVPAVSQILAGQYSTGHLRGNRNQEDQCLRYGKVTCHPLSSGRDSSTPPVC